MINLHPIFVHFPVALLSMYAVAELVPFKIIKNQPYWFYFKAILVVVGVISALAALGSGDMAAEGVLSGNDGLTHLIENPKLVIQTHEMWAQITFLLFGSLAAGYVVEFLNLNNFSRFLKNGLLVKIWNLALWCKKLVLESPAKYGLVLFGLLALTFTAALGGSIVYGPDVDPFVGFIYKLLIQ